MCPVEFNALGVAVALFSQVTRVQFLVSAVNNLEYKWEVWTVFFPYLELLAIRPPLLCRIAS